MVYWNVDFSCGHSGDVEVRGNTREREGRAEWMSRGVCPECFKQGLQEQRELDNKKAADENKEAGLPQLVGSEKIVAWAEKIRRDALASKYNSATVLKPDSELSETQRRAAVEFHAARKHLETEVSAKWWIENRHSLETYCSDKCREMLAKLKESQAIPS